MEPGCPNHSTYLDNVVLAANDILPLWEDTLEPMQPLVCSGFPLNTWKLQLLVRTLNVLGVLLAGSRYQLGSKALKKLFGSSLPKCAKDLMALLGRLNFAG